VNNIDKALISAVKRGVDVEIITAKKRDIPAYMPFKNWLLFRNYLKNDIKVYETTDKYIHMKGYQVDGKFLTFGSFNIDKWSWCNNNEVNFYTEDAGHNSWFDGLYGQVKLDSERVKAQGAAKVGQRLRIGFWEGF
jgi:phosphatidylserine/phosphatidylglycerophosphate/cardiolipin synthase-like enzyme